MNVQGLNCVFRTKSLIMKWCIIIFLNIMYVDIGVQPVSNSIQIVMQIRMWFLNKLISGKVRIIISQGRNLAIGGSKLDRLGNSRSKNGQKFSLYFNFRRWFWNYT